MSGVASVLLQLFCMPYLLRRYDHAKMYNTCMAIWPFCYAFMPLLNIIATAGIDEATGQPSAAARAFIWMGIGGLLLLARTACLAYS